MSSLRNQGRSREIKGDQGRKHLERERWPNAPRAGGEVRGVERVAYAGAIAAGCFETRGVVMDQQCEPFASHGPFARRAVRAHAAARPAPSPERPALRRHSSLLLDSRRVPLRGGLALLRGLAQAHLMRRTIRRNQTPSDAIRRHQTQSDSHRRTARSSSGAVPGGIAQVDGRWNWTVKRTCGEGRGAVVSTCMLEHLHDGRWNWTVKRTSKPRRNQTQSDAIRRNQTQSDSHRRTSKPRRTGSFRWYHTAPN